MNGYLLCIIGTVLLSSVLTAVLPEGKTSTVIKGITKLACLLVIIAPIPQFLQSENLFDTFTEDNRKNAQSFLPQTVIQTDEEFIKYYSETRIIQTQELLQEELQDKYAVATTVSLEWELNDEYEIKITKIRIRTENEFSEEGKKAMWEYLTQNYCSEVLIE